MSVGNRRGAELPGPPGLPVLGNLHQMRGREFHDLLESWAERYGPVFAFRVGSRRVVAVSDPEIAGEILRDRPEGFRRPAALADVAAELGIDGVFFAEGETWRRQRQLVLRALNIHQVNRRFEVIARSCTRLGARLERESRDGVALDPLGPLTGFTVDVTSELAFGLDLNVTERGDEGLHTHITAVFEALSRRLTAPVPYWRFIKLPADRALDRSLAELESTVTKLVGAARERRGGAAREPADLLESMLEGADHGDFSDREIAANVLTLLLAGEDTTANTMAWALYLLARHPRERERWAAEARSVLGDSASPLGPASLDELHFGEAVLSEAMRLKSVAPIIGLESLLDTEVGGVAFPAGTRLVILARLANVAGDPRFRPESRLRGGGDPRSSLVFGAGPRFCPGRNLAFLEAKAAMATIATGFEFELANPSTAVTEQFGFVMRPRDLQLRMRSGAGSA
jgi:cytochrome P450